MVVCQLARFRVLLLIEAAQLCVADRLRATESDNFFREPRGPNDQATWHFEREGPAHEVKAWRATSTTMFGLHEEMVVWCGARPHGSSRELEAGSRANGVEQLLSHDVGAVVGEDLEQVHTCRRRGQVLRRAIAAPGLVDRKRRVQVDKAQQGRLQRKARVEGESQGSRQA